MIVLTFNFFYSPDKGFDKLKETIKGIKDYIPSISFDPDKVAQESIIIPIQHSESVRILTEKINEKFYDIVNSRKSASLNDGIS